MNFESIEEYTELIYQKKKIIFTLISNSVTSILNEITITGAFSNADLLFLIDDVITNLNSIIELQFKQLAGDFEDQEKKVKYCINEIVTQLEDKADIIREKNAMKITKKSFISENSVFKSLTSLEKDFKSVVSKLMYQFNQCLS